MFGTLVQVIKSQDGCTEAVPIEQVKPGDEILAVNDDGTVAGQPVIFVTEHPPGLNDLVEITLQSGKSVTPTHNHMMAVRIDGSFKLKQAALVEIGDIFCSRTECGEVIEDQIVKITKSTQYSHCVNVIIPEGYLLVNDIAGSSRAIGDFCETLRVAGLLIYRTLGTSAVIKYCKFGDWLSETWVDRLLP